jgi:hypothetical protein
LRDESPGGFNCGSPVRPEFFKHKKTSSGGKMGEMWKRGAALGLIVAVCAGAVGPAQAQQQPTNSAVEEIVVTARRTGIPVWKVTGPKTTIVLIGSIEGVSKDTRWDPGALTETLRRADRVMFPSAIGLTASPLAVFGILWKARKMASLPKGQTLDQLMPAEQFQRLLALKNRGVLKAGFERSHPLFVAERLRDVAAGKRGYGPGATRFVQKAVSKYKIKRVPITTYKAKPILNDFFASPPRNYVPCLMASVALVEAGPGAVKARSDAWAERRVPDVLASTAEKTSEACSPKNWGIIPVADLRPQIRQLMSQPQLTVAVVSLGSLAERGGVLDDLSAAGFEVQGPRWRR